MAHAAVGLTQPVHTNLHSYILHKYNRCLIFLQALSTETEQCNLTVLSDTHRHTLTAGASCVIEKAYRYGHIL